eukprot:CAMPEP_0170836550 /NCGR_PEP_ID=MMETSP0734-20130129/2248_1 /TAXON_ID=186038 /ORGANISM="Fragilariopsis kerguelensis, Strain L26-C5" /LENGTH=395 /DNA_ID=CAMNT_0011203587 /DNA_START=109 /DNA_END=1296 /DNA_ORIENTATION=+
MLCQCHQHQQQPQHVSFGDVTIRDYDRALGDCWDLTYGLGIGWKYLEHPTQPIPEEDPNEIQHYKAKIKRMKKSKVKKSMTVMVRRLYCRCTNNKEKKEDNTIVITSRRGSIIEQITRRKSTTSLRNIPTHYQDQPCSVSTRKQLLKECGEYTSQELIISETERKRLRFEYNMWNSQQRQAHGTAKKICYIPPSPLLLERVLATNNNNNVIVPAHTLVPNSSPLSTAVTTTKRLTTTTTTTTTTSSGITIDTPMPSTSNDGPQSSKLLIDRIVAENKKKDILPPPLILDSLPFSNNEQQQQQQQQPSKLLIHRVLAESSSNNCQLSDSFVQYMGISSTINEQQQSRNATISNGISTDTVSSSTATTTTTTTTTNTIEICNDAVISSSSSSTPTVS